MVDRPDTPDADPYDQASYIEVVTDVGNIFKDDGEEGYGYASLLETL